MWLRRAQFTAVAQVLVGQRVHAVVVGAGVGVLGPRGAVGVGAVHEQLQPGDLDPAGPVVVGEVRDLVLGDRRPAVVQRALDLQPLLFRGAEGLRAAPGPSWPAGRRPPTMPRSRKCWFSRTRLRTCCSSSGTGIAAATVSVALVSISRPLSRPSLSRPYFAPGGSGVSSVIPASSSARWLQAEEWPSQRWTNTGWVALTWSRSSAVGPRPSGYFDSSYPKPWIQASAPLAEIRVGAERLEQPGQRVHLGRQAHHRVDQRRHERRVGVHVEESRHHGAALQVDGRLAGDVGLVADPGEHAVGDPERGGEVVLAAPGEHLGVDVQLAGQCSLLCPSI